MTRLTKAKLFIDGGDPKETAAARRMLGDAGYAPPDGQTTNPSLVAKNPDIAGQIAAGNKLAKDELLKKYREIVQGIEQSAPGEISIEVYADKDTKAEEMVAQAREMNSWITSAVIKLPITEQGLRAAEQLKGEMRLNLTLCFSQEQAAAVYAATVGAKYSVFVSPFVGRLDDAGLDGIQHVRNVLHMFAEGDGHVEVLAASFRRQESFLEAIRLGTQAVTINFKLFGPWGKQGFPLEASYASGGNDIPYQEIDLFADWKSFNIQHDLTDTGLARFAADWNALLK